MPKNKKYSHHARSCQTPPLSASQNFLTSGALIRRLLDQTDIGPQDLIVEIGPGKGHITRELLPRCRQVLAAELDPALCARLTERFANEPRLRLYKGDFFAMPLPRESYKVFANIPFSRTTDILRRLTEDRFLTAAWLVVELGAAKRFTGQGREGLSSLSLKPYFDLRIARKISREEFHPSPRVDAALLEIRRKAQPDLPLAQREAFRRFLERGLSQGARSLLTKRQMAIAWRLAGVSPPVEDANMRYVQWLCLFRYGRRMGLF